MVFVVMAQIPNLINVGMRHGFGIDIARQQELLEQTTELEEARKTGKISTAEYNQRIQPIHAEQLKAIPADPKKTAEQFEQVATYVNIALPPGWLPLSAYGIAERIFLPAALAFFGMVLIGAASLWRGYRTTLRLYTGQYTSGKSEPASAVASPKP